MSLVQSIDYAAISPALAVVITALVVLLADLAIPKLPRVASAYLSLAGTAASMGLLGRLASGSPRRTFCFDRAHCSYVVDNYTLFFQVLFAAATLIVVLLSLPLAEELRIPPVEYHVLLLMSLSGMVVLAAARDLLTLLVALEVVSLPAFVLVGLRRGDPRGAESAFKFFLFSVVSTAFTVYGIALIYGATGTIQFDRLTTALTQLHGHPGAMASVGAAGVVLVLVGFAFKLAAVPFHFWVPDTYQGAPVPIAAFLSVASKAAGFAGLILLLTGPFASYADIWGALLAVLAAVTMTVGNVVALRQWHLVRLLAWSTVAQAGYLLMPLGVAATAVGRREAVLSDAVRATLAYLAIYAAMNLGAFVCAAALSRRHPRGAIEDARGLVSRAPWTAALFALFLTALAGLPPGVAGLFAKVVVFRAAVHGHVAWLAVVAAVNTVIGLAYYLRVAGLLFVARGEDEPTPGIAPRAAGRSGVLAALALTAIVTVALSVYPQPLLHVAGLAAR